MEREKEEMEEDLDGEEEEEGKEVNVALADEGKVIRNVRLQGGGGANRTRRKCFNQQKKESENTITIRRMKAKQENMRNETLQDTWKRCEVRIRDKNKRLIDQIK